MWFDQDGSFHTGLRIKFEDDKIKEFYYLSNKMISQ